MGEMGMCTLLCTCYNYIIRKDTYRFTEHFADRYASSSCKGHLESNFTDAFSRLFTQPAVRWKDCTTDYFDSHSLLKKIPDIVPTPSATFLHESGRGIIRSFILPKSRYISQSPILLISVNLILYCRGKIHHIQPGNPNGRQEADRIFLEYQEQAASGKLPFRRWPLRAVSRLNAFVFFSEQEIAAQV